MVSSGRDSNCKQLWHNKTVKADPTMTEKRFLKEAEKLCLQFEQECLTGLATDNKKRLDEYVDYYIDLREQREIIKATTAECYRHVANKHIKPYLGHLKLVDIRPDHLNVLYSKLSKPGYNHNTGGKLSSKTILEVHRLLHTVLKQAVIEQLILNNPADRVQPPKVEAKEAKYYELEDVEKIYKFLEAEPVKWRTLVHLLLVSGCRRGEALGLKWDDIDFDRSRIHITKNVLYIPKKGVYISTPKTKKSIRWVTMPVESMNDLIAYRQWQISERLRLGDYYQDQGFLFTQEDGSVMHPASVTH